MHKLVLFFSFFAFVGCNASTIAATETHPIATVSAIPTRAMASITPSATVLKYAPGLHLTSTPVGTPDPRPISSKNIANLVPLVEFEKKEKEIVHLAWAGAGNVFATISFREVTLYNATTLAKLYLFPTDEYRQIAFNPNGSVLAARGYRGINLWDTQSGKLLREINTDVNLKNTYVHDGRYMTFSPDGRTLAASINDNSWEYAVVLWDIESGKVLHILEKQVDEGESTFFQPTFSPDGKSIAFGSYRGKILVWDVSTGKLLYQLEGHSSIVYNLVFSRDGRMLISGSSDGSVRVWDLTSGKQTQEILLEGGQRNGGSVTWIALSPNGATLLARADKNLFVWDFQNGKLVNQKIVAKPLTGDMFFSPDGRLLLAGIRDSAALWGVAVNAQPASLQTAVAATHVAYPLKGSVRIQAGRMIGGIERKPMDIPVEFQATSPFAPVTEMRVANECVEKDQMDSLAWGPYAPRKIFSYTPPGFNFFWFKVAVQFRDAKGNLSPIYCDAITVEGMPGVTP